MDDEEGSRGKGKHREGQTVFFTLLSVSATLAFVLIMLSPHLSLL